MDNIILYHNKRMKVENLNALLAASCCENLAIRNTKHLFLIDVVIAEYTRPARFVKMVHWLQDLLSDPELLDFPQIGTLKHLIPMVCEVWSDDEDPGHMIERTLR